MIIRWRRDAVADLADIRRFIAEDNPAAANAVTDRIIRSVERLTRFPESGRQGRAPGTREVVIPGLPYIVVYRLHDERAEIVAVFHGARSRR